MKALPTKAERTRRCPSDRAMNTVAAIVGLVTLAIGVGWLIYERVVNLEVPYFAIPLVLTVPVIAAAAVRCIWD